jgi:putative ABC transport system permease protein
LQEPFVGIAAHRIFEASLSTGEQAQRGDGVLVSGSYFSLLGLQPALGRLLGPEDDRTDGQAESVVLTDAYWRSEFGADPQVVGLSLIVTGVPLTIVGVAPPGFHGTTVGARARVFVPISFLLTELPGQVGEQGAVSGRQHINRGLHWVHLFARLAPGVSSEGAAAAINPPYRAILNDVEAPLQETNTDPQQLAAFRERSLVLEPGAHGQSTLLVPVRGRLEMLLAVSGAVLLLCCANVVGLLLIRGSARTGEMALRASMGATRGRLATLLLAESLLLAVPAAIASLPVAALILRGLATGVPGIPPAAFDASLSIAAALAAITISVVAAVASGLFPLRAFGRADAAKALQGYGGRQTSSKAVTRFRTTLATAQIALAMTLLAMTGVFAHSLANIARIESGLALDSVVTFSISPQTSGYSAEASESLFDRLEEGLAAVPGVSSVALSRFPLLTGGESGLLVRRIEGELLETTVHWNQVSPGFFQTLGIGLLAGREFRDDENPQGIAIVNRRFAERFGVDVGSSVGFTTRNDRTEIVGVVADAKYGNVTGEIQPQLFQLRGGAGSGTFYVRSARSADELVSAVRDTVTRVAPVVPIAALRTMEQQVTENLATERFVAGASTAFAVLATALAALGLYGLLAYSVAQRSREIALRIALGAPTSRVRRAVLRQVAPMGLVGIVLGLVAAVLLGRAASSLLFGIGGWDPLALAAAAAVLALVTFGAAYVPARRASRVDPMVVLRYE